MENPRTTGGRSKNASRPAEAKISRSHNNYPAPLDKERSVQHVERECSTTNERKRSAGSIEENNAKSNNREGHGHLGKPLRSIVVVPPKRRFLHTDEESGNSKNNNYVAPKGIDGKKLTCNLDLGSSSENNNFVFTEDRFAFNSRISSGLMASSIDQLGGDLFDSDKSGDDDYISLHDELEQQDEMVITDQINSDEVGESSLTIDKIVPIPEGLRKVMEKSKTPEAAKPFIHPEILETWAEQMRKGLSYDYFKDIDEKYEPKHHFPQLAPPILDDIVKEAIPAALRRKDATLMKTQEFHSKALVAMGEAMSMLADEDVDLNDPSARHVAMDLIWDSASLMCAGAFRMSLARKAAVITPFQREYKQLARDAPIGKSLLFDGKAEDWLRHVQGVNRTASQLLFRQRWNRPQMSATQQIYSTGRQYPATTPGNPGNSQRPAARLPQGGAALRGQNSRGRPRGSFRGRHPYRK
uniref:GMP synthase [glutamine-hydrolyzing] n=3 Tax=Lygus hesperus TaxID=30085 RepID=A0A0A9YF63_LYGHE